MKKYEYNVINFVGTKPYGELEVLFNKCGQLGWKLAGTYENERIGAINSVSCIFIREFDEPSPAEVKVLKEVEAVLEEQVKPADPSKTLAYASMTFALLSFICVIIYILSIR